MSEQQNNQLALVSNNYALMNFDKEMLKEIIGDNLGANGGLSPYDLDVIKIPSGGATTWEVPTSTGIQEMKEVQGIIVSWRETRAYWSKPLEETGGGEAPDCSSDDGVFGIGSPGGDCATCSLAQFGSADKGGGQACKLVRHLFLIRENGILPIMLNVSPGSNKVLRQYFMRLTSEGTPYYGVVTSLTLEKDKNGQGITYAKVKPMAVEKLAPERFEQIKAYRKFLLPALEKMKIDHDQQA